jgi:flagellar biosynthetic protein FliR/type III secretion protein T
VNPAHLEAIVDSLRPHVVAVGLIATRILPATFLCPIFGGQAAPQTVRIALCLALSLHAHLAGDIKPGFLSDAGALAAAFARELLCGTVIGLIAALPFDAARMGGRFLDTFRGANAEASLPATGSREAATGDLLYQLLCAIAFAGVGYRLLAVAILGSFRAAPLGLPGALDTAALADLVVARAGSALAAGLAIGAPAAAISLLVDAALGIAARAAPQLSIRDVGAPAKLLVGAAAILLSLGTASQRLLEEIAGAAEATKVAMGLFGGAP